MDRRIAFIGFAVFLGPFGGNTVLSMLHTIRNEFHTTPEVIVLSITFFMLPYAFFMLFSGAVSDLWDRRKTIMAGLATYAAGCLVCGLAPGIVPFLAGRLVQGLGFAFVNPVALAFAADIVGPSRRGEVMGWMGSMTTLGTAAGPLLGGVASEFDWRLAFLINLGAALGAIAMFASCCSVPSASGDRGEFFRLLKAAAQDRGVMAVSLSAALAFLAYGGVLAFLSTYLTSAPFRLSDAQVGMVISGSGVAGILASPLAGRAADRFGRSAVSAAGLLAAAACYGAMAFTGGWLALGAMFFAMGAMMAFGWAGLVTLSVELMPGARGTSSSVFNSVRFLGFAVAPQVFTVVFLARGMGPVFLLSAAFVVGAAVLALGVLGREKAMKRSEAARAQAPPAGVSPGPQAGAGGGPPCPPPPGSGPGRPPV
jgi:predicted MFS family arabinose efflux permease